MARALLICLTVGIACAASYIILRLVDLIIGLRVSEAQEIQGLDRSPHGEDGYGLGTEPAFALSAETGPSEAVKVFAPGYAGEVALEGAAGD